MFYAGTVGTSVQILGLPEVFNYTTSGYQYGLLTKLSPATSGINLCVLRSKNISTDNNQWPTFSENELVAIQGMWSLS